MKSRILGFIRREFVDFLSFYELFVKNDKIDDFGMKRCWFLLQVVLLNLLYFYMFKFVIFMLLKVEFRIFEGFHFKTREQSMSVHVRSPDERWMLVVASKCVLHVFQKHEYSRWRGFSPCLAFSRQDSLQARSSPDEIIRTKFCYMINKMRCISCLNCDLMITWWYMWL
jgi:hypothetical protein